MENTSISFQSAVAGFPFLPLAICQGRGRLNESVHVLVDYLFFQLILNTCLDISYRTGRGKQNGTVVSDLEQLVQKQTGSRKKKKVFFLSFQKEMLQPYAAQLGETRV